ncbi:hypothetical protein HanPI659440_Chr10g0391061 [Helianthus annuus]|nr:hypothetical protein HanPI659440_Chr10g0391061 [Helianthus annuus]
MLTKDLNRVTIANKANGKRSLTGQALPVDSKQARWELGKERVKRIMDAKNVCANAR